MNIYVSQQVTPTLRSCWDQGTNVIVSYDYPAIHDSYMWSKISYFYGDSMKIARVESVLSEVLEKTRPSHCEFSLIPSCMLLLMTDTFSNMVSCSVTLFLSIITLPVTPQVSLYVA